MNNRNVIALIDDIIRTAYQELSTYDFDDAAEVEKFIQYFTNRSKEIISEAESIKESLVILESIKN